MPVRMGKYEVWGSICGSCFRKGLMRGQVCFLFSYSVLKVTASNTSQTAPSSWNPSLLKWRPRPRSPTSKSFCSPGAIRWTTCAELNLHWSTLIIYYGLYCVNCFQTAEILSFLFWVCVCGKLHLFFVFGSWPDSWSSGIYSTSQPTREHFCTYVSKQSRVSPTAWQNKHITIKSHFSVYCRLAQMDCHWNSNKCVRESEFVVSPSRVVYIYFCPILHLIETRLTKTRSVVSELVLI